MKKIRSWLIVILICVVGIEIGFRAVCAIRVSPDMLLYGTRWCGQSTRLAKLKKSHTVRFHDNAISNYSKYFPNQNRKDKDEHGDLFEVMINSFGFRGREFKQEKAKGTIRLVTLGASSTFGYYDRDNETYPYYMGQILEEAFPEKAFEIINLGIPHLKSENIFSLFECEALKLAPDFVTYYEGYNDAATYTKKKNLSRIVPKILKNRFLTLTFIESLLDYNVTTYSKKECEAHPYSVLENYLLNIAKVNQECIDHKIVLIVANQQAKLESIAREKMEGITYKEEIDQVKKIREEKQTQ